MAGTRTVHRGSRGRFAGASQGKAEKVPVGRGYTRSAGTGSAGKKTPHSMRLGIGLKKAGKRTAQAGLGVAQIGLGTTAISAAVSSGGGYGSIPARVIVAAVGGAHIARGVERIQGKSTAVTRSRTRPKQAAGKKLKTRVA